MEILKTIFPVAKLVKPGKIFRFLLITLVVLFATLIVKFGLFMDLKGDTVFGKAVAVGKALFALYALLTMCVNWAVYMKKSEGRGRFFKSLIGIAVGVIVIIPMTTLPTYQLQEVLDAPLKSEEMNVAQIEEEFIQEDNNTVIEQYGEEVFEEETEEEVIEEVVEEPEYLIPVFDEMIEPYFDSEKGEVAILLFSTLNVASFFTLNGAVIA